MRRLISLDELVGFRARVSSAKDIKAETPTLVVSGDEDDHCRQQDRQPERGEGDHRSRVVSIAAGR